MELARKRVALAPSQIGQWIATPAVRWLALLGACAAYLQGGLDKALDLAGAINELRHFGIAPAAPMAITTIITELVGSALILTGFQPLAERALVCGLRLDGDLHCQPLLRADKSKMLEERVLRHEAFRQRWPSSLSVRA
jgi:DoxX